MEDVTIEQAKNITEHDLAELARLGAVLVGESDSRATGEYIRSLVKQIIESESQVLLLARFQGKIVGMATLALLVGPIAGRKIYLDDFVADPKFQGKGIGSKLWQAMLDWGREHDAAKLTFTSNPKRQAAHQFYLHKGAEIYDTCVFKKLID